MDRYAVIRFSNCGGKRAVYLASSSPQKIHGEVYEVDETMLLWMDRFEGHPEVYERIQVLVSIKVNPAYTPGRPSIHIPRSTNAYKSW